MRHIALFVSLPLILACGSLSALPAVGTANSTFVVPTSTAIIEQQVTDFQGHMTVLVPLAIRELPCVPSKILGYLLQGDVVQVTQTRQSCADGGQWVLLQRGGWANVRYLK